MKTKDIAPLRNEMLKQQAGLCPLCIRSIRRDQAALDHCHDTGRIRAVLHRNCNSIEGRIKHWARRSGIDHIDFLTELLEYWKLDHSGMPLHPRHKTPEQKELTVMKRKYKKLKTISAKKRYERRMLQLQTKIDLSGRNK